MAETVVCWEFKMTLLANGLPSGPARVAVTPATLTMARFEPSGNRPFLSAAHTFAVEVQKATFQNNFVYGYMTVLDCNNYPLMVDVPFCAYVGDVWPQAPVGIVHNVVPKRFDDGEFVLFSVIIERA